MFSRRLHWDTTPNPLSELLQAKRGSGEHILDLTESNPTHAGLAYPPEVLVECLSNPGLVSYEPNPRGLFCARESIARYYRERGRDVLPDHIHLTASTSEAYSLLFKLLADPGDEIVFPVPSYPLFEFLAGLEHLKLIPYVLKQDQYGMWRIDRLSLELALSERTRAVVIVNPNNPTGSYIEKSDLVYLSEFCAVQNIALISDEVFLDYGFESEGAITSALDAKHVAPVFVASGISKALALPQMKLGWIVSRWEDDRMAELLDRLDLITDTYLSVNTPVQVALPQLFERGQGIRNAIRQRTLRNYRYLQSCFADHPTARVPACQGGWYGILALDPSIDEHNLTLRLLQEHNVFVHPGYFFEFPSGAHLVVSLLTTPEDFAKGINVIREMLPT